MPDNVLTPLVSREFVLVASDSTVEAARAVVPFGYVAVVMRGALPAGVLTEDRLLGMEEAQQPLSHYAGRFLTPTLTPPGTALTDILLGLLYGPSVRWHLVVAEGEVLGVIAPGVLFALLAQWQQQPPAWLPQPLRTVLDQWNTLSLGSLFKLAGDPIQPQPRICGVCPATDPPHALQSHELDYQDPLSPTCKVHAGERIVWQIPCS